MDQFIVRKDERAVRLSAMLRSCRLDQPASARSRAGTRGIDQFIGEPDMVNRGHGSAFIRTFIDELMAAGDAARSDRSRSRQYPRDPRL